MRIRDAATRHNSPVSFTYTAGFPIPRITDDHNTTEKINPSLGRQQKSSTTLFQNYLERLTIFSDAI